MSVKKSKQEKRPSSDNFVDLHIFVVPYELWMEKYRTAYNSSTLESISAGFVRVPPLMTLEDLRTQIKEQLSGGDILPHEYVFLRCVGRCLAIVNKVQELSLKVKHFLPPVVPSPEIFVLFGNHESLFNILDSPVNTASDLQDYGSNHGGKYFNQTRETDEHSICSSPERVLNLVITDENFDSETIQRRVHFEQNDNISKQEHKQHGPKLTDDENLVNKETDLKRSPKATKTKLIAEKQHTQPFSHNRQDKEIPDSESITTKMPTNQKVQDNQVYTDYANDITSRELKSGNRSGGQGTKQASSSFEEQSLKSPRNKIQKKNPLLHSKTALSLLQSSRDETNCDGKSEENQQNEQTYNERRSSGDENSLHPINKDERKNATLHESLNNLELSGKNDHEMTDKAVENHKHPGSEENQNINNFQNQNMNNFQNANMSNFQEENELTNENDGTVKETQIVDSTQEDIKHSADISVASSGFESLNQSNDNRHDIDRSDNNFGVTMADKENLVLQLQAELNAVRSERSNSEKTREQLLRKAKNLQNQNNQKRNQAKTVWKKRYFEEKKKTVSLEERCNQLRYEVEVIHKKILSTSDGKDRDSSSAYLHKDGDPEKLNSKIMLTRKENELEELRRRVEEAKIKLGSEMKLRDNAQKELKQIRDEVIDKKINATLVKKSLSLLETRSPNEM